LSWYFPPANTIGALRVGKLARFLADRGHDVYVIAGKRWGHPETLAVDLSRDRVIYADWFNINGLPSLLSRILRRRAVADASPSADAASSREIARSDPQTPMLARHRLTNFYVNLTNVPDDRVGWLPRLYWHALRICRAWSPDLIFASGPPFTALLGATLVGKRLGIPWVAELRDRWADDPYYEAPRWRQRLEDWIERRTLASAAALVTVTEPWAEFYRSKYAKPVATIYNGYDPLDFEASSSTAPSCRRLTIGYAGRIYPGRRDPTPLFRALTRLGADAGEIRVVFCGTDPAHVLPLARSANAEGCVEVRPAVPYKESLAFQQRCDVLLLLQWNDSREQGNCPGKFFEYLACLRPVLILGLQGGVPDTLARQRHAGVCSNDPEAIAAQLRLWLEEKRQTGRVKELPSTAREGLSRAIQFEKLEQFLRTLPGLNAKR
jgi:glycosyltransferase involved in cell wall biosynthesis